MPASTCSKVSKTQSGLTHEPVPLKKSWKRQLSNPKEVKQPTKKGKKKHNDSDSDNNDSKEDDNNNNNEGNDEGKGEGEKVVDDGKGTKRAKRAVKAAKCVPATFFNIDSNVFSRRKALDRMREDVLTSAAPLLKKLLQYLPLPPFF